MTLSRYTISVKYLIGRAMRLLLSPDFSMQCFITILAAKWDINTGTTLQSQ